MFNIVDYGVYTTNPGVTFNYDTKSSYTVDVRCNDDDGGSVTEQLTVYLIKNEVTYFTDLSYIHSDKS